MIVQIDHIALESDDFKKSSQTLTRLGYKNKFYEENKRNLGIKRRLVKKFSSTHDLALFSKENCINIELLHHFSDNKARGYITPLFENLPDKYIEQRRAGEHFDCATLKGLNVPIKIKADDNIAGFRFNKFIVETNEVGDSVNFWENFGFRKKSLYKKSVVLEFFSPYDQNIYQIFLQPGISKKKFFLDDLGFNCIAFVSSSTEKELLFLKNKGIIVTETERIIINGKMLKVFFAKGPSGELVEVIDIAEAVIK